MVRVLVTLLFVLASSAPVRADEAALAPTTDFSKPEPGETHPAGAATVFKGISHDSFSHSSANMAFERELNFKIGNAFFKRVWVSAPSSTKAADGLGPLFNSRACQRCHLKDGRGHPPAVGGPGETAESMFLRLSIPPETEEQRKGLADGIINVVPEPTYGGQLQTFAIQGHRAEGRMTIDYTEQEVRFADGGTASLRAPKYGIADLGYGKLHPKTMISPRVAPPMIGLGLLEAVPESAIMAHADPDDRDGDGISGRDQRVWDPEKKALALGRFGWKGGNATINAQDQSAFAGDIGISTPLFPDPAGECTAAQAKCRKGPHGDDEKYDRLEASKEVTDLVQFYARNLGVPARRDVGDATVLRGKELFYRSGCASCHVPKFRTAADAPEPEQRDQLIWPYTDMLLHDMGPGLADNRPEARADGQEWRTPPLWGLGLTEAVSGHTLFLHDGRARDLTEAILWHDGEAKKARETFRAMPKPDRDAVLRFLNSL